jgi:thymidylate synthase (FAD)
MTVELITSRDVMAEITRHRLASFAIESQRYVCMKGEISFIQPECYIPGDTASAIWRMTMAEAERVYHKLLENGWLSQDARKVLPNSTATRIVMKANLREWRHIFGLRTSPAAYPEIRV